jgi:hypothetical protein
MRIASALTRQLASELKPMRAELVKQSKAMEELMKKGSRTKPGRSAKADSDGDDLIPKPRRREQSRRPLPSSSRKPGKRNRSLSKQNNLEVEDYEDMMHKVLVAQGGDEMLENFMPGFVKRFRGQEPEDSDSDGDLGEYESSE